MPSLVVIGPMLLEKSNFVDVFFLFCNYLPLKKPWPFIWTKLNFPKETLCQVWLKLASWKKDQNVDSLRKGGRTNDRRSVKFPWAFSSGELKEREAGYYHTLFLENEYLILSKTFAVRGLWPDDFRFRSNKRIRRRFKNGSDTNMDKYIHCTSTGNPSSSSVYSLKPFNGK